MNTSRNIGNVLTVEPSSVDFLDIQPNVKYIQTLTVRNLSASVKRIRCERAPERHACFKIVAENQIAIGAGLSVSVDIEFLTRKRQDCRDILAIIAEDFRFEVPLTAIAPCASISFETFVDFGVVNTKRTHQRDLLFVNEGSETGTFEILGNTRAVKLTPSTGTIAPRCRQKVKIELMCEGACTVHEMIEVKLEGHSSLNSGARSIDIHGTCVDQSLTVKLDGNNVDQIDFGTLYHGQNKVTTVQLVNDGPTSVSFNVHIIEEGGGNDLKGTLASSPAETVTTKAQTQIQAQAQAEHPLAVSPFTGQVPASGTFPLTFTFSPAVVIQEKGFVCNRKAEPEKKIKYSGKIESEELGLTIPLKLVGSAVIPVLKLSPDLLQFGQCPVNHRRDIVLRITNLAETLGLDFQIPRVPHMTINPMKGKLGPQQNMNVIMSYMPKALGKFDQKVVIKYCNNLYSHNLQCYGEAPVVGEKQVPVKGLEKTGRDFDPEHKFVNQEDMGLGISKTRNLQSLTQIMKTDLSKNFLSSEALDSIMMDMPEPTPYSLSPELMHEHVRNKQKYNKFLKEQRWKRKKQVKGEEDIAKLADILCEGENALDLGMVPGSGLKSPRFSVDDIPVEKLGLIRQLEDEAGARGVTGHQYKPDENKLIKKKHKPGPTTQAENRDCGCSLESWQLGLITAGPRKLDFGNIYVRSQVVKSFSVYNDLPQAILVSMQYDAEELSRSSPVSQVVPSAQAAGFDVTICSAIPQSFQRQVVYMINGIHPFKLLIKANITPVQVKMSHVEINFKFSDDNLDRTLTESVVLTNPGNAPARFTWQGMNAFFSVSPTSGVIRAGVSTVVEVMFTPPSNGQQMENTLSLKVEDGEDMRLICTGVAPEALCGFQTKKLDLGKIAVGLAQDRSLTVLNHGKSIAVFHVENMVDGITVSPVRGRIAPEGKNDLEVRVLLDKSVSLETTLSLNIRGGKPIKIPVLAHSVIPTIEFLEHEIEFGQLTLGADATQPISLKNSSAVEGTLYVNLQPYPEFVLSLLEEKIEGKEEETEYDSSALQPMTMQQYQLAIGGVTDAANGPSVAPISSKQGALIAQVGSGNQSPTGEDEDDECNSQIYKITVPQMQTLRMQLTYKPADLGQHFFEFPIVTSIGEKSEGLQRVVHAEALAPRMLIMDTMMDFKTKVVATGIQSVASMLELALKNVEDVPIEWKIDTEPLKKYRGVFTLDPNHGLLHPEQICLVRASFSPNEPIEYKTTLNVYISPPLSPSEARDTNEALPPDETKVYMPLRLKGQGTVPKLVFDRKEIVLPIVPLGIRSRCLFYIKNDGYESLEVKYRLPTQNIKIPLSINFPEGQQLGITKPKIPVEIFFLSAKPISFCAKIEFLDNETGSYTLPVSGTTENCILTCHHYLQHNVDFYTLEGDPVQLHEKEDNSNPDIGAAPSNKTNSVSHQSVAGYGGQDMSQAEFLVRWMNGTVLKNQLEDFPRDLISSGGRYLTEMIMFLSGKEVSAKAAAAPRVENAQSSMRSSDRGTKQKSREMLNIQRLLQNYKGLLEFLKQNGALLSSVRPEHFLSNEQYFRYQQSLNAGVSRRQCDKAFYPKSMEAWMTCILQTIKIFLLNRVTYKMFKTLPGMTEEIDQPVSGPIGDEASPEPEVTEKRVCPELQAALDPKGLGNVGEHASNVCSIAELILLRWLNFHFWRANNNRYPPRKICCFDSNLDDSIVFAVVIQSHVPNCAALQSMHFPCTTTEQYEDNATNVVHALTDIGLPFPIQPSDITDPQPKDMLLFVLFLFQNLQHYVPKTVIVFSTLLGVNMTRNIELYNPSKKPITYSVRMESTGDFTIKDREIKIDPKSNVSFPVEFHSRFFRLVEARIVFTSRREGNVHAAAMVFKLRSRCTGRKPRKTIPVGAVLYEVGTTEVELENPFNEDAEFELNLREMMVCDADRNPVKSKRCEGIDPFYLNSSNRLLVKAKGSEKVTICFLPFDAPAYFSALLGFYDAKAGEFYYEILGQSGLPFPLETYKLQVKAEDFGTKELILPHRNVHMDRARMWLEARVGTVRATLPPVIVYEVKLTSPFYTAPKTVTVTNVAAGNRMGGSGPDNQESKPVARNSVATSARGTSAGPAQSNSNNNNNNAPGTSSKLSLEFRPKEPGIYQCTVMLTSDVDIRIYQIEGTGTAPNTQCSLQFHTQARKPVVQEIPIVNPTEREWSIKPVFSQNGHEFDGPREFFAKKRQPNGQATMSYYPLTFKPDWVCDVKGQLALQNAATHETYEYELHGIAEEPLAEEHVVIKCEAREKTSHKFRVRNYSAVPATFEVESDLVHISGPSSVSVEGKGECDYELVFQPLQAGQVTGCIMFRDQQTRHFTWYTVELMTVPPKPQQQLSLNCVVRQAVAVDIKLVNPMNDLVVFEVVLNGDGLLGEAEFVLAPKETATYELVFSPLLPSRKKGTAVFFNDMVGEFWYDLELIAEPASPEELPPMECELGRTVPANVKIDNPTGQEVILKAKSTNKINFKVLQQRIVLPPLDSTTVTIEYSPASLGVQEEAQVIFEHPVVGQWAYKVQGVGLPPSEARKVVVVAQVKRPVSSTITFKNPFLETIQALISLDGDKGVFSLLTKRVKVTIGPLTTTQIPFSFSPPSMTQHSAELAVSVVKPNLTWIYQIQGVAEAPADTTVHTFTIQARQSLEQYYNLNLVGLDTAPTDRHALSCQLEVPTQYQALVSRCFEIALADPPEPKDQPPNPSHVSLHVRFTPLRPFVAMCNLLITRASGGRWRFDLKLEATEPEVDDTISIQSPLNKPASVAFRLCNHSSAYSEFDAFFDAESAYEFTVQPTSGVLEPAGTSGTTFVITYKPTEYGKPVQGKLIIQTEDVYWSYLVRGTHPKYSAPVAEKPKVATRLSKDVQNALAQATSQRRRKNFIRDNMQGASSSTAAL